VLIIVDVLDTLLLQTDSHPSW